MQPLAAILEGCRPGYGTESSAMEAFKSFLSTLDTTGVLTPLEDTVHNDLVQKTNEVERTMGIYFFDDPPKEENAQPLSQAITDLQDALDAISHPE